MSVYIPVDLQRQLRDAFANCCAYCRTAEDLTVAIFEFEHIMPRSEGGKTFLKNYAWPVRPAIDLRGIAQRPPIQPLRKELYCFIRNATFGQSTSPGARMERKSPA